MAQPNVGCSHFDNVITSFHCMATASTSNNIELTFTKKVKKTHTNKIGTFFGLKFIIFVLKMHVPNQK